jgi:hypothetical protein
MQFRPGVFKQKKYDDYNMLSMSVISQIFSSRKIFRNFYGIYFTYLLVKNFKLKNRHQRLTSVNRRIWCEIICFCANAYG